VKTRSARGKTNVKTVSPRLRAELDRASHALCELRRDREPEPASRCLAPPAR
jgi:hypothetical protein